jgi:hypothetical protein
MVVESKRRRRIAAGKIWNSGQRTRRRERRPAPGTALKNKIAAPAQSAQVRGGRRRTARVCGCWHGRDSNFIVNLQSSGGRLLGKNCC